MNLEPWARRSHSRAQYILHPASPSFKAESAFQDSPKRGPGQAEKMRSNGSGELNRVYILDCQNTRIEFWAYSACLPQHGVRFPSPRTFGCIFHGTGGGRADGSCQHAGHPPRRNRWLAPYSRLRNRLCHRRSNPLLPGPPRRSLSLFRPVQPDCPDRPGSRSA